MDSTEKEFEARFEELRGEASLYVEVARAHIKEALEMAQYHVEDLRKRGFAITVKYPIGVREPLTNVKVEAELFMKI
jgi:hypothetical protein